MEQPYVTANRIAAQTSIPKQSMEYIRLCESIADAIGKPKVWAAVGALLDAWEFMANDEKQVLRQEHPGVAARLDALMAVVVELP